MTAVSSAMSYSPRSSPLPLSSSSPPSAASMATDAEHQLRVLVVDDNSLNLSMLTRLLRKRFSHMLDDAPVAVDSGLKALQLLRENIYDVILMDIQMPFLSGVDCTKRIRKGADGILPANQHATIIAVTTATGDQPEALYRKSGFDGLIAKPVQYDAMSELLVPLLAAAREAAPKLSNVVVRGVSHKPSVPVTPLDGDRIFFLPTSPQHSSAAPDITRSSNFEALLNQQTRVSLQRYGACALARTGSIAGVADRRLLRKYDDDQSNPPGGTASRDESSPAPGQSPSSSDRHHRVRSVQDDASSLAELRRRSSLSISQSGLNQQIQREMEAAHLSAPSTTRSSAAMAPSSSLDAYKWPTVTAPNEQARQDEPLSPHDHFAFVDGFSRLLSLRRPSLCPLAPHPTASFGDAERRGSGGDGRISSRYGSSSSSSSCSTSCDPSSSSSSERASSLTTESASDISPLPTPSSEVQFDLSAPDDDRFVSQKGERGTYTPTMTSPLSTSDDKQRSSFVSLRDYSSSIDDDQRTLTGDSSVKVPNVAELVGKSPKKRPSFGRQNASPNLRAELFMDRFEDLSLSFPSVA